MDVNDKHFCEAFESVLGGNSQPDVILVFSGVWSFLRYFSVPAEKTPDHILRLIDQVLDEGTTVVFPSYNYSFPRTRFYDPTSSRPETGVLAETYWKYKGVTRTNSPMESYLCKGPRTKEILERKCSTGWGDDSVMGWFDEVDARVITLGVPWEYCGYYHRAEEYMRVPYRYFKKFHGVMRTPSGEYPCEETMYVRSLNMPPKTDTQFIRNILSLHTDALESVHPEVGIVSNSARAILSTVVEKLKMDPYCLLKNKEETKSWVAKHKEQEISAMPPEQQYSP